MADPLEGARALLGGEDERDEIKNEKDYFLRLTKFLNTLVREKVLTPNNANSILTNAKDIATVFSPSLGYAGLTKKLPYFNLLRYNDDAAKEELKMFVNNLSYTSKLQVDRAEANRDIALTDLAKYSPEDAKRLGLSGASEETIKAEIQRQMQFEADAMRLYGGQQQKQLNEAYWLSQTQQFAGASGFTADMEEEPRELAGLPSGLPLYEEALKGLPSQMAGYFAGRPEEVITDEIQSARMQWWQTLQASQQPDPLEQNILRGRERIATLKQMLASTRTPQTMEAPFPEAPTAGTTSGYKEAQAGLARSISTLEAQSAQDIAQSVGRIGNIPERPTGVDPLTEYLEKYPFTSEYMKLTARQRGAYSYRFRPPTRWY